ncbi:hypothetical protein ABPG72_020390 [Tetrahymena utriculariae]
MEKSFCMVIIDVNSFIQNQSYIPKLQLGISKINKIVKLINERQIIIYTETLCPQLTDLTSIINILMSLSPSQSYKLAQIQLLDSFIYNSEALLKKCQELVLKNLDFEGQIYAFNLYTFDPGKKRLNRYLATNDVKLLLLLCDDEDEFKRRFLSYKINYLQGDMNQFIKIQIPNMDKDRVEEIKIYTFQNYIIDAKITQVCIKLSENSNNILMLRKYNFDPQDLQELKRVRQLKRQQNQQLVTQLPRAIFEFLFTIANNREFKKQFQQALKTVMCPPKSSNPAPAPVPAPALVSQPQSNSQRIMQMNIPPQKQQQQQQQQQKVKSAAEKLLEFEHKNGITAAQKRHKIKQMLDYEKDRVQIVEKQIFIHRYVAEEHKQFADKAGIYLYECDLCNQYSTLQQWVLQKHQTNCVKVQRAILIAKGELKEDDALNTEEELVFQKAQKCN